MNHNDLRIKGIEWEGLDRACSLHSANRVEIVRTLRREGEKETPSWE